MSDSELREWLNVPVRCDICDKDLHCWYNPDDVDGSVMIICEDCKTNEERKIKK